MDPLPDDVRQFLDRNIDGLEQLEALRILATDHAKEWYAVDLAGEVQTTLTMMVSHIAILEGRGLVTSDARGVTVSCRYGPRTPELEEGVARLLDQYQQRPVTMIRMVYAKADAHRTEDALKTFADAFRLRKET